jgi:hypothetical protein
MLSSEIKKITGVALAIRAGVAWRIIFKYLYFICDVCRAEKQHASNKQAMFEGIFGLAPAVLAGC